MSERFFRFPIPRIAEGFVDVAVERSGGRRLTDDEIMRIAGANADYLYDGAVVELKIVEEEGLTKNERQDAIAALFAGHGLDATDVSLDLESTPAAIREEYKVLLGTPIKKALKKAGRQIKSTKLGLGRSLHLGVAILVNNGYGSVDHELFAELALECVPSSSSHIDFVVTVTLSCHGNGFDTYVFLQPRCHTVRQGLDWPTGDRLIDELNDVFDDAMTQMMRNPQMDPDALAPVCDVVFERDGVKFIKEAPDVPDSRESEGT